MLKSELRIRKNLLGEFNNINIKPEKETKKIIDSETDELLFFGNDKSIVAIKVADSKLFKSL